MRIRHIRAILVLLSMPVGCVTAQAAQHLPELNTPASLRRAVMDLAASYGPAYPQSPAYLERLDACTKTWLKTRLADLAREALLANPLLDFEEVLVVQRSEEQLGLMPNWESNSSLPSRGYDNQIAALSLRRPEEGLRTLFRPEGGRFAGDVDLHFNAEKMLFSMPGQNGRWQLFEVMLNGTGLRQLPLIDEPDVDNYDACYLPDGNIVFSSTAPFVGVPCVTGSSHVSNLYLLDTASGGIRRLTFEQDHDWCPTLLNNGRVLYLRWEYSDIPHFASRILFHMNPDGTQQMEYYGSNSYWPNAMFYARPVPDHPSRFVAIVGGHHDVPRMGELVLFDTAQGRHEASGVVQRIPGYGKTVDPVILDGLVQNSWPKFLHPYPLSDRYCLVSAKPGPEALWGIYLVDVFDNMTLIKEMKGYALFEPLPLRPWPKPPVIPSTIRPDEPVALVSMSDVYVGNGLAGVPRGTVKALRLFTYHFAYHGMGGQVNRVGLDGPWDIKRVVGTVPVEADGSAFFRVPANTPISVQPLDEDGRAIQLMRSWMTAMPGETLSCVGCHEHQSSTPPTQSSLASRRAPSEITPWYGPTRGFSFAREVQPVLDKHCVSCHDGKAPKSGKERPDFRALPPVHPPAPAGGYRNGTQFTPSYLALRRYVRTATMESDMHLLPPYEFHAGTTQLIQLIEKPHHGVQLGPESWDRLVTWIDLNAPAHGTWHEIVGEDKVARQRDRRRAMMQRYAAGRDEDPEAVFDLKALAGETAQWVALRQAPATKAAAATKRKAPGPLEGCTVTCGDIALDMVRVPAGTVLMGDAAGCADEQPVTPVRLNEAFWISCREITNEQFASFDPAHESRLEHGDFLQFSIDERGYPLDLPQQPVVHVSWQQATAFCAWLSAQSGAPFLLPTEAQWEYACRAGTLTELSYGPPDAAFGTVANLADVSLATVDTFAPWALPSGAVHPWRPARADVNDGHRVAAPVGSYAPNPWGLYDMHGNVAEWTRTAYAPYPYDPADGRVAPGMTDKMVVRGGSWYDRPCRARSAFRLAYVPWQGVFNVGFRVVCPNPPNPLSSSRSVAGEAIDART